MNKSAKQKEFDNKYIGSGEVCSLLGVKRAALCHMRKTEEFPTPIEVNGTSFVVWVKEEINIFIAQRNAKKGKSSICAS